MSSLESQKDMLDCVKCEFDERGFEYRVFERSCFDVLARNDEHLLALKVLHNVDSFTYGQAFDLKNVTAKMNASPMLIGCMGRNFVLKENCVYERFNVPAMSPETFENSLDNIAPAFYSKKGKTVSYIRSRKMKQLRSFENMSLEELSRITGISKKTLHMGEKYGRMSPEVAGKIEDHFSVSITMPINVFSWKPASGMAGHENIGNAERKAVDYFSSTGFDCMYVKTAPIKIINTYENKMILSTIISRHKNERSIKDLKNVSEVSMNDKMAINLSGKEKNIDGVASVGLDELKSIGSCRELFELIYERESNGDC